MRVAIVDDRTDERLTLSGELQEAGHESLAREASLDSLDTLVDWMGSLGAEALVCDQRLSAGQYAAFHGAQAVSFVIERLRTPSLLVSSFIDTEGVGEIRRWRRGVPVLLGKDELTPETINRGFELCRFELEGDVPPQRIPRRTGVHIEGIYALGVDSLVEAIVPGWNPQTAVSFPSDLIVDDDLRGQVERGEIDWVLAKVNVDAETQEELFFVDFEPAPAPFDFEDLDAG